MKGGKTRIQRAMVMASGKLRFVKNIHRGGGTHRAAKTKHHSKRGGLRMARRRGKSGRSSAGGLMRTAEQISKMAALFIPAGYGIAKSGTKLMSASYLLTGYAPDKGTWDWRGPAQAYGPFIALTLGWKAFHKINGLIRRI